MHVRYLSKTVFHGWISAPDSSLRLRESVMEAIQSGTRGKRSRNRRLLTESTSLPVLHSMARSGPLPPPDQKINGNFLHLIHNDERTLFQKLQFLPKMAGRLPQLKFQIDVQKIIISVRFKGLEQSRFPGHARTEQKK